MKTIIAFRLTSQGQLTQVSRVMHDLLFLPPGCEVQLYEFETLPVTHTVFNAPDERMEVTLEDWNENNESVAASIAQRLIEHGWDLASEDTAR